MNICKELTKGFDFDRLQAVEAMNNMNNREDDFTIDTDGGEYRFITNDEIENVMVEELKSDPYILGCFADKFIADYTNIPLGVVQTLQNAEAYEELGNLILSNDDNIIALADWPGHHFPHYDFDEHNISPYYTMFRVN